MTAKSAALTELAEKNRVYFDEMASKYESINPAAFQLTKDAAVAALAAYPFDEASTTVLDFACGPGLVSQTLAPSCKSILGVDISENMVTRFNTDAQNNPATKDKLKAILWNELDADAKFDVAVCSMAYHHVDDIVETTLKLKSHLKDGGVLFIIDLTKSEGRSAAWRQHDHKSHAVSKHHEGFSKEEITKVCTDAGFSGVEWSELGTYNVGPVEMNMVHTVFIAKAI